VNDEIGHLPLFREQANLVFQVAAETRASSIQRSDA
jgi:hypothetical protein